MPFKQLFAEICGGLSHAIESSDSNSHIGGNPLPADALRAHRCNPFRVENPPRSPENFSLRPRIAKSSADPFNDQASLEFSDGAKNSEDQLSGRSARVASA
jgi:hypothetical protein